MDLDDTLRTLCPDAHGRVLGVLAHADEPLTASQVAHRAGLSPRGVVRALNDLVAGGLVWRAKVTPYWHWHVLYREHLAADLVLALAHLDGLLARRLTDHVAAWQPPPATLALRQPCPTRTDPEGRAMIDLLLVRPEPADDPDGSFDEQVAALVQALPHWTGNHVHDHVLAGTDAGEDDELAEGSWWLLAGRRVPGLAFTDPPQQPNPEVSWPAGLSAPAP